jgi:hypothetical protein
VNLRPTRRSYWFESIGSGLGSSLSGSTYLYIKNTKDSSYTNLGKQAA